jgi:hypothetical protein
MKKKIKIELVFAIIMAVVISALAIYANLPKQADNLSISQRGLSPQTLTSNNPQGSNGAGIQQSVSENIQGEMRTGSFESTVEGLKTLTFDFGGIIPYLSMSYDGGLWSGTLDCNVPTENVTSFTFTVRQLISVNGTVTHIAITTTEAIMNQTIPAEQQFSSVSIGLREVSGGASPAMDQLGAAVPWLVTGLVWVGEGLIVGVPLCFVSLGIVVLLDRGIVPAWKKELKGRSMEKTTP